MKLRSARARRGLAFFLAAVWLGIGLFLWGAFQVGDEVQFAAMFRSLGWGLGFVTVIFAVIGIAYFVSALRTQWADYVSKVPSDTLSWRNKCRLTGFFSAILVLMIIAGVLHALVWNLEAKVPGMSRNQVVAALKDAGEYPGVAAIVVWAAFWLLIAASFFVFSLLGGLDRLRTMKQVVVTGLILVATVPFFYWITVFNLGMGIADTFGLTGADAGAAGYLIPIVGLLAGAGAILIGFTPTVERTVRNYQE